jgi:hypothetical protein
MKRRNNYLKELKQRREAATGEPMPETTQPETPPSDPEVRAEWLQDELTNTREQLEKEKAARQQAERRAEQQARPSSLRDLLRMRQIHKRRTWR